MCMRPHVKYFSFLSDINDMFSAYFRKVLKYETLWKSVRWEPSCFRAGEDREIMKAFRNFVKMPETKN